MDYRPSPIPTADVILPESLVKLTERLARNTHEIWAEHRLGEGWRYGPHRDDSKKEHPCLVSYDRLPESEKQFDRNTAMETLKAIIALGYTITPPNKGPAVAS
jgi:hypothetical protein